MPRRFLLLSLCLATAAGAQEGEIGQPYWISTPPGAGSALKQAVAAVAGRDWTAASHALQQIFDRYPTAFAKSGGVYRGARAWAAQILASAPAEMRTEYERIYGPDAEEALHQALATGDRKGLLDVVRTYEGTNAGLSAVVTLADDAIRRGQPTEARLLLMRVGRLHAAAAGAAAIRDRLALAAARDHAEGGPPSEAGARRAQAAADESWPMLGGRASRDRVPSRPSFAPLRYTIDLEIRQRLWDNPPQPDATYYPVRGARNDDPLWRDRWSSYSPVEPVVSRGVLVASEGKRVSAYNLFSGVPLWQYPEFEVENDGRTNLSSIFTPVIAEGVVYASIEVPVAFRQQMLQEVPIIYYLPMRRLVALDLETGTVLWRHDDEFLDTHPEAATLRNLSVTGAPVVRGDRLYAAAVASEGTFHSYVVAIDRNTGDVVYTMRVSNGQQELNLFGRQLQECMPMPLTEAGGVLYLGTNLGVVAAVDALLGTPLWATGYETERIPSTYYWFEAPRRWPRFANGPPLVSGDVVVAAPSDATSLLGLDRRNGERIFAVPQEMFAGDRPLDLQVVHAVDAERAYVGGRRGVVALWLVRDPKKGAEPGEIAWTSWFLEDDTGAGRGFLAEDALWVPTTDAIYRIDPATGKCLSATAREGRDRHLPVHLVWGDGVLVTAGHDARARRGIVGARFDGEAVLAEARERARLRPDEPGPLLDAADIHLAAAQVSPAVDLFRRAKALADARGAAAVSRRAEQGLHRALLRRAWASLDERALERAEGEFEAALRSAPDDRQRIRARRALEEALAGAGEDEARKWRAKNLRAVERDHGDTPDETTGRPLRSWALLRLAELQVDEGSPRRALAFLQQLVERDPDGEDGRLATRRIRRLLEQHRDAYEPYEKKAVQLFESALAANDLEALQRGLRIYANAQAADAASLELARRQLRAKDATGAARTMQGFLAEHAASPHVAEGLLLMVEALHERGSHGPAYAALLRLRGRHGEATLPRPDGTRAEARTIADEWLAREPYASLARSARRRDLAPKLRLLFEQEFLNDLTPEVPDLLGQMPEALRGMVMLRAGTRVRVLEAETGTERYAIDFVREQPKGPLVLAGDRLCATTEGFVHVFDAATGRPVARRPVPDGGRALSLTEHRGQVFLLYRERRMQGQVGLAALHPVDGSLLWSQLLPAGAMDPPGASYQVVAHEDRLLLLSTQPVEVWVLDPTSGAVENRIALDASQGAERKLEPILLPGGRLLVGVGTRQQGQGFQYRFAYSLFLLDPGADGDAAVVWKYRSRADDENRSLRHLNVAGDHVAAVDETRGATILDLETGREIKSVDRLDVPGVVDDEDRYLDPDPQPRHDSLLLVVTPTKGEAAARLTAYEMPDLRVRFSVELTEGSGEVPRLVDAQGVLVVSIAPRPGRVGTPRLRLLDPLSGDLLEEIPLPRTDQKWTSSKVQNGVLLVTTDTNWVFAYGPR